MTHTDYWRVSNYCYSYKFMFSKIHLKIICFPPWAQTCLWSWARAKKHRNAHSHMAWCTTSDLKTWSGNRWDDIRMFLLLSNLWLFCYSFVCTFPYAKSSPLTYAKLQWVTEGFQRVSAFIFTLKFPVRYFDQIFRGILHFRVLKPNAF